MNINLNETDFMSGNSFINVADNTTAYSASHNTGSISGSGIRLDISSSSVTDNNAYEGHGKTAEEIALDADSMDLTARRNYMAVMSNSLSTEDFNKLNEDGFDPGSTDFDEAVTILDHIKAAMLKGGADITGYTDDISEEALVSITGSEAYASELATQFADKDIPLTAENVKDVTESFERLSSVGTLDDGSYKYLIENNLTPSVDNIYTAAHTGSTDSSRQARGYYNAGDVNGYYAKKSENIDVEALKPQMTEIAEDAGFEATDEILEDELFLIEKGIPLTTDSITQYENIKSVELPMAFEEFASHAADAISDGISVGKADLSRSQSLREEAIEINDEVQTKGTLKGRRVLEEVRLSMSVEANLKLLRSGYQIDTAPMEELIDKLKKAEEDIAKTLMDEPDEEKAISKKNIFDNAIDILSNIKTAPIEISTEIEKTDDLETVNDKANDLTLRLNKAGRSYETMMTSPRADLGDSIKKAFNNVDNILEDLNLPTTDSNRRAVRILGYNQTEITAENIASVREKDDLLKDTLDRMTPGKVLKMVRDGMNPITMPIEELDNYLRDQEDTKQDMMSYSKFLYKLEKDDAISDAEKESYIGIYRLTRAIEKSDHMDIGALNEMGAELTFNNILTSLRSRKHNPMDYLVDDDFGGLNAVETRVESISDQINKGFVPEVSDLKELLSNIGSNDAEKEYISRQNEEIRQSLKAESAVLKELQNFDQELSAENIEDMQVMIKSPQVVFDRLKDMGIKKFKTVSLDSKESAEESYKEMTGSIRDFLENAVFGDETSGIKISSNNVYQVAKLYQHTEFLDRQSDEENYEIPTEIGGEDVAINLKLIHNENDDPHAVISFESKTFGRVAAKLSVKDGTLSGYCTLTNKDEAGILEENKENLKEKIEDSGMNFKEMYFAGNDRLNLSDYRIRESRDTENDTDVISTENLYKVSKAFIEYVVENA